MNRAGRRLFIPLLWVFVMHAGLVFAQAEPELISEHKHWTAYVLTEGTDKVCYMISAPLESSPEVEGRVTWVTVTHRPGASIRNEVGVIAGYDYKSGSGVNAIVDTRTFTLFAEGDGAWLRTADEESAMVEDMKKGRRMSVVGVSSTGVTTTDEYSLLGFTAAHRAINKSCL